MEVGPRPVNAGRGGFILRNRHHDFRRTPELWCAIRRVGHRQAHMPQTKPSEGIVLADTATKLGPHAQGAVIVTGSHGGRYAAYLTLKAHPRALIHSDAGAGKDDAGIAVLAMAEALGVAAATASHASCRIGDAADMIARGTVSHANAPAAALGRARRHALPRGGRAAARSAAEQPRPGALRRDAARAGGAGLAPAHRADRLRLAHPPRGQGPDHRHGLARRPRRRQSSDGPAGRRLRCRVPRRRRGVRTGPASPACRHSTVAASPASRYQPPLRVSGMQPPSTRTA